MFYAAVASILLYGCTTWTLTKRLEKKLDGNYTRMLRAILNKSWRQHPTRHQLYGHLSPITKTIQVRRTRYAGHCWRSRDELISDVLLWTPTRDRAKARRPARTYIQQLCEDTGCCLEDLPEEMNDWEKWRERVRDIRATSTAWWWWWYIYMLYIYVIYVIYIYIYVCVCVCVCVCVSVWMWASSLLSLTFYSSLRCRRGSYSFSWIIQLTLDPYLIMLKHHVPFFESLVWLHLVWNPGLLDYCRTL